MESTPDPSHTEPERTTTLDQIVVGAIAHVVRVTGEDLLANRLIDLGFWPGTEVRLVRKAPFGDPCQFSLRGYQLVLRKEEARRVVVE